MSDDPVPEPTSTEVAASSSHAPEPSSGGPPEPVLLFREPAPGGVVVLRRRLGAAAGRLSRRVATWWRARREAKRRAPGELEGWRISGAARVSVPTLSLSLAWVVAGVCAACWSVVGLIFWLPVLLGAVAHFSVAHLHAMFQGRIPEAAGARLRSAISFYGRGFAGALDVARGMKARRPASTEAPVPASERLQSGRLVQAAVWALVAWYPVLLVLGFLEWPPIDLPGPALDGTWGDLSGLVGEGPPSAVGDVMNAASRAASEGTLRP